MLLKLLCATLSPDVMYLYSIVHVHTLQYNTRAVQPTLLKSNLKTTLYLSTQYQKLSLTYAVDFPKRVWVGKQNQTIDRNYGDVDVGGSNFR